MTQYATIWKVRQSKFASAKVAYQIEFREAFDISQQQTPNRVEYAADMRTAKRIVSDAGAKLWN